ncbi:MAG: hypothetical protein GQ527_05710 [Bacteroidales bacterium]|nr:hypothetical protein [Bacteroidales bacterium]
MSKTLVIILNHNLPEITDDLYHELEKYKDDSYDLRVMDNGSREEFTSVHTSIRYEENLFWGGALNKAFDLLLQNDHYDSLLFLNNDIEVNGEIFVKSLRKELFDNKYAIVSPCISGKALPWKQMQNWGGKSVREVKWIDNQAPLIHRKLVEAIGQFDENLYHGWGQELICFDVCQKNNWKIGVCDFISIVHFKKQTFEQGRLFSLEKKAIASKDSTKKAVSHQDYQAKFRASYFEYFAQNPPQFDSFENLVSYGNNYSFNPIKAKSGRWFNRG